MKDYFLSEHVISESSYGSKYRVQILDRKPTAIEMMDWPESEKKIYSEYPPFTKDVIHATGLTKRCLVGWVGGGVYPHRLPIYIGHKKCEQTGITDGICEYCVAEMKKKSRQEFEEQNKNITEREFDEIFFEEIMCKMLIESYKKMEFKSDFIEFRGLRDD